MKRILKKIILPVLMTVSVGAVADVHIYTYGDAPCDYLLVQISNQTGYSCRIKDVDYVHGSLHDRAEAPASILSGDSKSFSVHQTILYAGPEIIFSVDCGEGGTAQLRSQQNYSLLRAGKITAQTLSADKLAPISTTRKGSCAFPWRHGALTWTIQ